MTSFITEIKHNLNKPDQSFSCCLLYHGGSHIVISYRSSHKYCYGDFLIPAGTLTLAYYEQGLKYVLWKMIAPDGNLFGHYVHLCDRVRIGVDHVEYDDQLLDLWFFPNGDCRILDEDELQQACDKGIINRSTAERIRTSAQDIICRIHDIKKNFDLLLGTLGTTYETS